jgi:hypothetical protein
LIQPKAFAWLLNYENDKAWPMTVSGKATNGA